MTVDIGRTEEKKRGDVPLDDALDETGCGKYTYYLILTGGITHFAADCGVQVMSILIPAASCDLKLTSTQKGILTSMAITGMLTSAHLCGVLADVYGRRKVLLFSLFLQGILCIISSFANSAIALMVLWFIYGNAAAGVLTPVLVYINEFCPKDVRTKAMIVIIGFGALAEAYLPCVAWLVIPLDVSIELYGGLVYKSWRLYLALLSVPVFLSMFLLAKIPESPKYILNQGKMEETLDILKTIYAANKNKNREDFPITSVSLDREDKEVQGDGNSGKHFMAFLKSMLRQTVLLFQKTFIGYTLISSVVLLGIGCVYMVSLLWVPDQASQILRYHKNHNSSATICEIVPKYISFKESADELCTLNHDIFLIVALLGLAQWCIFIAATVMADRIGKRLLLCIILLSPGVLCIALLYIKMSYVIIGTLVLVPVLSSPAYPVALSIVMRYFPTSIRSNAASVTMSIGRIGISGFSLLFGYLIESYCEMAYWSMSALFIGSAVLCVILPSKRKLDT